MKTTGISSSWIGFKEKTGYSNQFVHVVRRVWVLLNRNMDTEEERDSQKQLTDYIGYLCNPEWYFERKKHEENKHLNSSFAEELKKVKAAAGITEDEICL